MLLDITNCFKTSVLYCLYKYLIYILFLSLLKPFTLFEYHLKAICIVYAPSLVNKEGPNILNQENHI